MDKQELRNTLLKIKDRARTPLLVAGFFAAILNLFVHTIQLVREIIIQ